MGLFFLKYISVLLNKDHTKVYIYTEKYENDTGMLQLGLGWV
jgi:hypothetical protein